MKYGFNLHTIAHEIKAAQDQCKQIEPFTSRLRGFGNAEAYAVAHLIHEMRINGGAALVVVRSVLLTQRCGQSMGCASRSGATSTILLLYD